MTTWRLDTNWTWTNNQAVIAYKDKIVIPHKIQKYVLGWYRRYLLHPKLKVVIIANIQKVE